LKKNKCEKVEDKTEGKRERMGLIATSENKGGHGKYGIRKRIGSI